MVVVVVAVVVVVVVVVVVAVYDFQLEHNASRCCYCCRVIVCS